MHQVKSTQYLIEKDESPTINAPSTSGANYLAVPKSNIEWYLPDTQKVSDAGKGGKAVATHLCNTYWKQDDISIQDELDFIVLPRLLRRAMGGTPLRTLVAAGVYDYEWGILPPSVGSELPASGIVCKSGPSLFLMGGNKVDKVKVSSKDAARAAHQVVLVGSGYNAKDPSLGTIPSPATAPCTEGRKIQLKYTDSDGSTEIDLSSLGGLSEFSFDHDNLHQRGVTSYGDPAVAVDGVEAGYVREVPRGNDNEDYKTSARIVPRFRDYQDWVRTVTNKMLTNFSILMPGGLIANVSGTDYFYELEIIIPSFGFETISADADKGKATSPINIMPFEDPTTKGSFTVRLRTSEAAFEGVSS